MWFIGVEVEQETSAPPPKKNPGSAPATGPCLGDTLLAIQKSFMKTFRCIDYMRMNRLCSNIGSLELMNNKV